MKALITLLVALAITGVAFAGSATASQEAQVRQMLGLPADAKMRYLADDGTETTFDAFSAKLTRATFDVKSDPATGITTLQLTETGGKREIGAVTKLPPLDARTLGGRPLRNADLAGKPTIINFFFSTCVPCIKEVPVLNAFARKHPEFNYIAVTHDPADEARGFVTQRKFDWPVIANAQAFVQSAQVRGFPTYLLVAKDGRIIGRGSGLDAESMKDADAGLKNLEEWIAARLK
jgi:cytochrome oxidase Cu insertion factor (SCO1/SenC/PrrC family)